MKLTDGRFLETHLFLTKVPLPIQLQSLPHYLRSLDWTTQKLHSDTHRRIAGCWQQQWDHCNHPDTTNSIWGQFSKIFNFKQLKKIPFLFFILKRLSKDLFFYTLNLFRSPGIRKFFSFFFFTVYVTVIMKYIMKDDTCICRNVEGNYCTTNDE